MTTPGTTTRLCTRQGLIVPRPMRVGSVLSCVLGPFVSLCPHWLHCCAVNQPHPDTMCAHPPPHSQTVCAHLCPLCLHYDSKRTPPHPTPRPTPTLHREPSERPCRQAQTHQQTRQRRAPQQRQQRETPSGWVLLGGNFGVWYPYRKPLLHV